jgi:hypothetical protein
MWTVAMYMINEVEHFLFSLVPSALMVSTLDGPRGKIYFNDLVDSHEG